MGTLLMATIVLQAVLLAGSACGGEQADEGTTRREATVGKAETTSTVLEETTTETVALQSESEGLRDTVAERAAEERVGGGGGRES